MNKAFNLNSVLGGEGYFFSLLKYFLLAILSSLLYDSGPKVCEGGGGVGGGGVESYFSGQLRLKPS